MHEPELAAKIDAYGWLVTAPRLDANECDRLRVSPAFAEQSLSRGGGRNLLDDSTYRELARSPAVRGIAEAVLGADCVAVRGLAFDKRPDANWWVPWHQDLTVAVTERRDVPGFGPWSVKASVPHTQAPVEVLERMLAVRVHLDACGPDNGPLHVVPGSHRHGILGTAAILAKAAAGPEEILTAPEGSVLAFRPLLLHSSHPATAPSHRRVIHFEFAAGELPGLEWKWRV